MSGKRKLTENLVAPKNKKEFTKEWARCIIVDYQAKTDPDWLLADCLKVLDVTVKDNPHPGMLSDSYVIDVTYTCGDGDMTVEAWFVKVPKSTTTTLLDEVEIFMYDKMFPLLQAFSSKACENPSHINMPIPLVFHCAYDENEPEKNILVTENLRDQGYKPLRPETCGLVFMRAAMTSLAQVHASAYAYQTALGGRSSFLSRFPLIKEDNMPKARLMKEVVEDLLEPYLEYLALVAPDVGPQLAFLKKFSKFLLGIFHDIQKDKNLWKLKIMVHGDSKIDNFMFKKNPWAVEEEYLALIIDWQGVAYDLLSGDLMWSLYGFLKNLPDKNSTVDTFMDYSIAFYHQELIRLLKLQHVDMTKLELPEEEYDATTLIKKGFLYEFLKTVLIRPLLSMKGREALKEWFSDMQNVPVPAEKDIFKTGSNFVHYIHLQITIATEIGTFHDLAPLCIQAMKDALFGHFNNLLDEEDEAILKAEAELAKQAKENEEAQSVIKEIIAEHDEDKENSASAANEGDANDGSDIAKPEVNGDDKLPVEEGAKESENPDSTPLEEEVPPVVPVEDPTKDNGTQTWIIGWEMMISVQCQTEDPTMVESGTQMSEEDSPITVVKVSVGTQTDLPPEVSASANVSAAAKAKLPPPPPAHPPPPLPKVWTKKPGPLTTTVSKPEAVPLPKPETTGSKKRKKAKKKKKSAQQEMQDAIESKVQELKEGMAGTKSTLVELKSLMDRSQVQDDGAGSTGSGSNAEQLKQAMDQLVNQVQNFHQTCVEELKMLKDSQPPDHEK